MKTPSTGGAHSIVTEGAEGPRSSLALARSAYEVSIDPPTNRKPRKTPRKPLGQLDLLGPSQLDLLGDEPERLL